MLCHSDQQIKHFLEICSINYGLCRISFSCNLLTMMSVINISANVLTSLELSCQAVQSFCHVVNLLFTEKQYIYTKFTT